jgi:hypothetical protein
MQVSFLDVEIAPTPAGSKGDMEMKGDEGISSAAEACFQGCKEVEPAAG